MDFTINYNDTFGYNEMFLAVHNGDVNLVNSLFEKNSAMETIRTRTLLHVAASRGHAEIAKTLLGHGATIGVKDIMGNTPLDLSLTEGNVRVAEILFKNAAVLSEKDLTDMESLRLAVRKGNFEMVKLLIANGSNEVDVPTDNSSLQLALSSGRLDIFEYLIKNGEKSSKTVEEDGLGLIRSVIWNGSLDTLKFLVDVGFKAINLYDVFNSAFRFGRHDMWKYLVTRLSRINANTYFKEKQLHSSIRMGQVEIVKQIVNEPSNEYESDTFAKKLAVYIAVESGSEEILNILLNAGYPVDSVFKFITPLHLAATFEHPRLLKLLLKAGADVNLQTEHYHLTPLHFAATAAQPAVVEVLLKNGANPSKTSKLHELPLKDALKIHAGSYYPIPVTSLVFKELTKVTKLLIPYSCSQTEDDLLYYAFKIRVSSSTNNSKPRSQKSAIGDSVFPLEIIRIIFNYLSQEEVRNVSEKFLLEECFDLSRYPPELLQLMWEYNIDSKSCFDVKISICCKIEKCQLPLICYTKNVDNLLGTISEFLHYYDEEEYNDVEKIKIVEFLELLVCRLVLLNENCDDLTRFVNYESIDELIEWQKNCVQEKIVMQSTKVDENFSFTFYDVLTKSMDKVAEYANNEDFFRALKSSDEKFPSYADFFKLNVEVAERRRDCIDECTIFMYRLVEKCYNIEISNCDIRHILQYLSIVDLRRFSAACS